MRSAATSYGTLITFMCTGSLGSLSSYWMQRSVAALIPSTIILTITIKDDTQMLGGEGLVHSS